VSELVNIVYQ